MLQVSAIHHVCTTKNARRYPRRLVCRPLFSVDAVRQNPSLRRMIQTREQTGRTGPASRTQFSVAIGRFAVLAIAASLMALGSAQADEPEDHYLRILTL